MGVASQPPQLVAIPPQENTLLRGKVRQEQEASELRHWYGIINFCEGEIVVKVRGNDGRLGEKLERYSTCS